jgi:hypothetical protein
LQPDETDGKDTDFDEAFPTTNRSTDIALQVGTVTANNAFRSLIAFDISSISAGSTINTTTCSLYEFLVNAGNVAVGDGNFHRVLQNWVEAEATWNIYSTGNNWATAGCGGDGTDRVATASATVSLDGTASSAFIDWAGAGMVADVQAWLDGTASNYGWLFECPAKERLSLRARNVFYSSDHTTAGERPKLVIEYTEAAVGTEGPLVGGRLIHGGILTRGVLVGR